MKKRIKITESDLKKIIKESVENILLEIDIDSADRSSGGIYTTINGIPMTKAQYNKWRKEQEKIRAQKKAETEISKQKKPKKQPKVKTGDEINPNQLHNVIEKLIGILNRENGITSLFVFKNHGERSFGPNAMNEIIKPFFKEFNAFSLAYRKIQQNLNTIEQWGKNNEHAVYSEAIKLSHNLIDMSEKLETLYSTAAPYIKQIAKEFQGKPAYEGRGGGINTKRELGLKQQLLCKSHMSLIKTIGSIQNVAKEIDNIASKGKNPLTYTE